jgi:magnesium-transporting ATPase (P-type)
LIIHYSFYKNAAVFLAQVWFGIFSGFSSQVPFTLQRQPAGRMRV